MILAHNHPSGVAEPSQADELITVGLLIALVGLLWPWITRLGLGRLPGDLRIDKPGFTFYAPFTTMIIVSVVVSLILWLLRR